MARQRNPGMNRAEKALSRLNDSQRQLKKSDRTLRAEGIRLQSSLDRRNTRRAQIREDVYAIERKIIRQEHLYSRLVIRDLLSKKGSIGLTAAQVADLNKLSKRYDRFQRFIKAGYKGELGRLSEICPWNTCWGCSAACGGCSSCGTSCSPGCAGYSHSVLLS